MTNPISSAGRYMEFAELRRVALEMALDRFKQSSDPENEDILELAEQFFKFLSSGKGNAGGQI